MADATGTDGVKDLGDQTQDEAKNKGSGVLGRIGEAAKDVADGVKGVVAGDGKRAEETTDGSTPEAVQPTEETATPPGVKEENPPETSATDAGKPAEVTPEVTKETPVEETETPVGEAPVPATDASKNETPEVKKIEEASVGEAETPVEQPEETSSEQASQQSAQASPSQQRTQSAGPSEEEVDKERRRMERRMAWDTTGNALGAALATAPGALGEGAGQAIGSVTRLMDSFFRDGPMSAPSRVLGEALSGADTAARLGRQAAEAYGIAENADRSALKGTYRGRMLEARDRAQRQGIARAHLEIARLGGDDLSQLDEDGLDRVEQGLAARRSALAQRLAEDHRIREARRDADPLRSSMGMQVMGAPMPTMTPAERREALAEIASIDDVSKGIGSARRSLRSQAAEQARRDKRLKAQAYDEYYDTRATPLQRFVMDAMGRRDVDWDGDVPADRRMHGRAFRALLDKANMMPAGDPRKARLEQLAAAYGRSYRLRRETDEQRARREAKEQAELDYGNAYARADPYQRAWFDEVARGRTKRVAPEFDGDIPKDHQTLMRYERFARARNAQATDPKEQQEWLRRAEAARVRRLQMGTAPDDWAHYQAADPLEKRFMERFGMRNHLDAEGMPTDPALDQRWANELMRLGRTEEAVHVMATSAARRSDPLSGVFRKMESDMRRVRNELMLRGIDPSPLYTPGFKGLDALVNAHPELRRTVAAYAATVASAQGMHALGSLRRSDLAGARAVALTEYTRLMQEAKQAVAGGASPEETYALLQAKMMYMDLRAQTLLKGGLDEKLGNILPELIAEADPNDLAVKIAENLRASYSAMDMADEATGRGMVLPDDITLPRIELYSKYLRMLGPKVDDAIDDLRDAVARGNAQAKAQAKAQAARTVKGFFKSNPALGSVTDDDIDALMGAKSVKSAIAADRTGGLAKKAEGIFGYAMGDIRGYRALRNSADPEVQRVLDGLVERGACISARADLQEAAAYLNRNDITIDGLRDAAQNLYSFGSKVSASKQLSADDTVPADIRVLFKNARSIKKRFVKEYMGLSGGQTPENIMPFMNDDARPLGDGSGTPPVDPADTVADHFTTSVGSNAGASGQNKVPPASNVQVSQQAQITGDYLKNELGLGEGLGSDIVEGLLDNPEKFDLTTKDGVQDHMVSIKERVRNHADNELRARSKEMLESALADPDKYDANLKAADSGTKYVMNGMMAWALEDAGDLYLSKAEEALNDGRIEDARENFDKISRILNYDGILNPKHTADLRNYTQRYIDLKKALENAQVVPDQLAEENSQVTEGPQRKEERLKRIEQGIGLGDHPGAQSNFINYSIRIGNRLEDYRAALQGNVHADKFLMRLGEDAYTGFYDKDGKPRDDVAFEPLYMNEDAASRVRRLATAYRDNLESSDEDLLNALKQAYADDGAEYKGDAAEPRMAESKTPGKLRSRFRSGEAWAKKGAFEKDFNDLLSGYAGMEDGPVKDSALLELGLNAYVGRYMMDRSGNLKKRELTDGIKGDTGERFRRLADVYKNNRNKPEAELLAALKKAYPTEAELKAAEKERKVQQKLMDDESKAAEENRKRNRMLLQDDEERVEQLNGGNVSSAGKSAEPPKPFGTASTGLTPKMIARLDSSQSVVDEMTNFNLSDLGNEPGHSKLLEKVVSNDRYKNLYEGLSDQLKDVVTEAMRLVGDASIGTTTSTIMGELPLDGVSSNDRTAVQSLVMQAFREKGKATKSSCYDGLSQSDRMRLAARVIAARRLGAGVDPDLLRETTAIAKSAVRSFIAKHPFRS